jgi:hypothetical protein
MDTTVALLWMLPTLFLHNGIHEGSHAMAANLVGVKTHNMSLLPGIYDGHFAWAHVEYENERPLTRHQFQLIEGAPILSEAVWFTAAAIGYRLTPSSNKLLRTILAMEMLASVVDMGMWFLGMWTNRPYTDAADFRKQSGWAVAQGRASSAVMIVPVTVFAMTIKW